MQEEDQTGLERRNEPRGTTVRKDGGARGKGGGDRHRFNDEEDNLAPAN